MLFDLHGIGISCDSPDDEILERWEQCFASRPRCDGRIPDIRVGLVLTTEIPPAPSSPVLFTQGDLLSVYLPEKDAAAIRFPRFGQLHIDLAGQAVRGWLKPDALRTYGLFEDVVAIALSPLLRRRHLFVIHAFAASCNRRAVLLAGDVGSGKTTTGISLIRAGWKLLSNDSPLLMAVDDAVTALAYPGLLSAYPDTMLRFPELRRLLAPQAGEESRPRAKVAFAAESVYADVWTESAPVSALVLPRVAHGAEHRVERLGQPEALRHLLPHAVDRWDAAMIAEQLQLLKTLVTHAPAFRIELGDDVASLPALMQSLIAE